MNKLKWIIILVNLIGLLVYFNWSVGEKEKLLSSGRTILLQLAPVDPRSLMQGDYMLLNYAVSQLNSHAKIPVNGYCVLRPDKNGVGVKVRLQPDEKPLNAGEVLLRYHDGYSWGFKLGAESYFFEEGQAEKFAKARYGGLKVDEQGNSVLVGLFDENYKLIKTDGKK